MSQLDIADFDEILSTARSIRRKLDFERPLDRQELLDCIDVAVQAPTGATGENWRFVVVEDKQRKTAIAEVYRAVLEEIVAERRIELKPTQKALVDRLPDIPAMIFPCVDGEPMADTVAAQVAYYGSILPAAWSLMLALRARRIGATWTTLLSARQEELKAILEMPATTRLTVMLPVGYMKGAVLKRADRLPAGQVTYWDRWGA